MDPLSIAASTVALLQTAGTVSATLYDFITAFRNADTRVSALCTQLSRLIKFLEAVDRTLRNCRGTFSLASVDEELWRQSALSLEDCKTTLDELATFINRIKTVAKSASFFRRAKVAMDLTIFAGDITSFEEKILKSNWALQTMLSAIQVSLSLRGSETQEKILYELEMLKSSIKQTVQAALRHGDGFPHMMGDPSDARVTYNLQNLARAAQNFHSSASSTASTIHGANRTSFWNLQSDSAMSVRGGPSLTPNKRQQIEGYIKQQRRMTQRQKRKSPLQRNPSSAAASVVIKSTPQPEAVPIVLSEETESIMSEIADENDEGDEEAEFQSFLLSGLEEVAKDSMLNQEFAKAQSMLEEAIRRRTGSTSEEADFKQLQIQLAVCYFFQNKWKLAEPLIDSIAKLKANFDPVVCNLLHALAIANLVEKRFEKAIVVCKQALQGKRRLKRDFGDASEMECNQTLGLLATIHDIHGNRIDAEALRRKLSKGFSYYHPENELEFIVNHPKLCLEVFGRAIVLDWRRPQISATNRGVSRLIADPPRDGFFAPIKENTEDTIKTKQKTTKKPLQTFHTKLSLYERLNMDSAKEVAGSLPFSASQIDETSQLNSTLRPVSSPEIQLKRPFAYGVTRFIGSLKERQGKSRDDWSTSPFDTEDLPSPSRQKLGKGFWFKSNTNLFKMKPKAKLRKSSSDDTVRTSFSFFPRRNRGVFSEQMSSSNPPASDGSPDPRPWRYSVDQWLRKESTSRYDSDYYSPDDYLLSSRWVSASQILEEGEDVNQPAELEATSIIDSNAYASLSERPIHSTLEKYPKIGLATTYDGREDGGFTTSTVSQHGEGNVSEIGSCSTTVLSLTDFSPSMTAGISSSSPSEVSRPIEDFRPSPLTAGEIARIGTSVSPFRPKPLSQNMRLAIPTSTGGPEAISLVTHHLAQGSQETIVETTKEAEPHSAPSLASTSCLNKISIINRILNVFKDHDMDELAVKERLEQEFDEFMQKEIERLWASENDGRQAWVPASYFKDSSPVAITPVGGYVDDASQKSQGRKSGLKKLPSLKNSELDDFSRAFHDAIKEWGDALGHDAPIRPGLPSSTFGEGDRATDNRDVKSAMEKKRSHDHGHRYQISDDAPTKIERAQKRASIPKLSAEKATGKTQNISITLPVDPKPTPQLNRKFSWESEAEDISVCNAPIQTNSEPVPMSQAQIQNRRLSCSSADSRSPPSLIRSPTSSSSWSSCASSFTSASSASTGDTLKFDPISNSVIFVGNDPTSPLLEFQGQSLDYFLENLSTSILARKSETTPSTPTNARAKAQLDIKIKPNAEPWGVDARLSAGALPTGVLPSIHQTDIHHKFQLERDREGGFASDVDEEGISAPILPRRSKSEINHKRKNEPSIAPAKVGGGVEYCHTLDQLQASGKPKAQPLARPTDIFLQSIEKEELDLKMDREAQKEEESMLNRSHPLRSKKRRRRKVKSGKEGIGKEQLEKRGISYPHELPSWRSVRDLRVGIAV